MICTRHKWDGPDNKQKYCIKCGNSFEALDLIDSLRQVARAAGELDEVADHRGDNQLPHPEDDPLLWTARMQTAWDEIKEALDALPGWVLDSEG